MTRGDLVFVYSDNINNSKCFIVYDKSLLLGMTVLGPTIRPIDHYLADKTNTVILLQPTTELTYRKKKELTEILFSIMTGERKLSIKEKLKFLIYISRLYKELLDFTFTDFPTTPITPANIADSTKFIITNITSSI